MMVAGACGVLSAGLLLPIPGQNLAPAGPDALERNASAAVNENDLWLVPADMPPTPSPLAGAIRTLSGGDPSGALSELRRAADDPVVGSYALLYLARAELLLERPEEAAAAARRVIDAAPGGYVGEAALWLLADAAARAERWAEAGPPLQALTRTGSSDTHRAYLRLGEVAEKTGNLSAARQAYATVHYEFPLSESATEAAAALRRLPASADIQPLDRERARAEQLYGGALYAEARRAWTGIRARTSGDARAHADLRIAQCDLGLRQYATARTTLTVLLDRSWDRRAEVEYAYLGVLRGLRRDAEYVARVDAFVSSHPANRLAERALDELGTHYIITDEDAKAAEVFTRLYDAFPGGAYADRAAWKAGWWAYRQREYAETVRLFTGAATAHPRADYRPSWLYWAARAHEGMARPEAAAALYRRAVADYRNSYYGREAATRLAVLGPAADGPAGAGAADSLALGVGARPPNAPLVQQLLRAGLYDDVVFELRHVQREIGRTPVTEATIAYALHEAGQLRPAITAMRRAYPQFMAEGGERLPVRMLRIIFPIEHWGLLQRYAAHHSLDRYLLAAQVAQESTFQADVRSSANAWGLMQILPSTGQRFARQLGIGGFSIGRLTDPETNVRIGTHYLARLVDQFGDIAPALAAYNAGENRVIRWQAERPGLDRDEFIDDIPYPETQFYVKRVIGTAADYRTLYGEAPLP
jgi:soluble lytic murein transglycosylase